MHIYSANWNAGCYLQIKPAWTFVHFLLHAMPDKLGPIIVLEIMTDFAYESTNGFISMSAASTENNYSMLVIRTSCFTFGTVDVKKLLDY
jgi:hypothetical protein